MRQQLACEPADVGGAFSHVCAAWLRSGCVRTQLFTSLALCYGGQFWAGFLVWNLIGTASSMVAAVEAHGSVRSGVAATNKHSFDD